jgi:hypothetical protein
MPQCAFYLLQPVLEQYHALTALKTQLPFAGILFVAFNYQGFSMT